MCLWTSKNSPRDKWVCRWRWRRWWRFWRRRWWFWTAAMGDKRRKGECGGEALVISRRSDTRFSFSLCRFYFCSLFLFFIFLKQSRDTWRVFTGSKAHAFPSLKSLKCKVFSAVKTQESHLFGYLMTISMLLISTTYANNWTSHTLTRSLFEHVEILLFNLSRSHV